MGSSWLQGEELTLKLLERLAAGDNQRKAEREKAIQKHFGTKDFAFERLYWLVMNDYRSTEAKKPGAWSVVSMADGQTYTNPQAYIEHLRQSGYIPVGHLPEVGSPEWEKMQEELRR